MLLPRRVGEGAEARADGLAGEFEDHSGRHQRLRLDALAADARDAGKSGLRGWN